MGWSSDEPVAEKKGMDTSSKILLAIIACVLVIIVIIFILLMNIEQNNFTISVDGQAITTVSKENLITKIDNTTYINIEEFAKLVKYEYHEGEYKAFTIEKDKCYVQGQQETASFYLNDNKVNKLPVNKLEENYDEYTVENIIKSKNDKMYAPINAISLGFNVSVIEKENELTIYTLDYLIKAYNTQVVNWGYTGLTELSFENQKALLYERLIVKKENGLYKIINIDNTKEFVADKYTTIEFSENTQEFLVTNSLGQVGIINLDGTTKIEPTYDSISVLDKTSDLYLIEKNKKFGVIKSGNITVIAPEYDSIGFNNKNITNTSNNHNFILDTLIPVSKNGKWGAFNKEGKLILNLEYDQFGSDVTFVEINGNKKTVEPLLSIEKCNGIVVKKAEKYGLIDTTGKELVPIAVESIYSIENATEEDSKYFMLYNGKEMNVIERLIIAGLIEDNKKEEEENSQSNTISNQATNQVSANEVINNVMTVTITNTTSNEV